MGLVKERIGPSLSPPPPPSSHHFVLSEPVCVKRIDAECSEEKFCVNERAETPLTVRW